MGKYSDFDITGARGIQGLRNEVRELRMRLVNEEEVDEEGSQDFVECLAREDFHREVKAYFGVLSNQADSDIASKNPHLVRMVEAAKTHSPVPRSAIQSERYGVTLVRSWATTLSALVFRGEEEAWTDDELGQRMNTAISMEPWFNSVGASLPEELQKVITDGGGKKIGGRWRRSGYQGGRSGKPGTAYKSVVPEDHTMVSQTGPRNGDEKDEYYNRDADLERLKAELVRLRREVAQQKAEMEQYARENVRHDAELGGTETDADGEDLMAGAETTDLEAGHREALRRAGEEKRKRDEKEAAKRAKRVDNDAELKRLEELLLRANANKTRLATAAAQAAERAAKVADKAAAVVQRMYGQRLDAVRRLSRTTNASSAFVTPHDGATSTSGQVATVALALTSTLAPATVEPNQDPSRQGGGRARRADPENTDPSPGTPARQRASRAPEIPYSSLPARLRLVMEPGGEETHACRPDRARRMGEESPHGAVGPASPSFRQESAARSGSEASTASRGRGDLCGRSSRWQPRAPVVSGRPTRASRWRSKDTNDHSPDAAPEGVDDSSDVVTLQEALSYDGASEPLSTSTGPPTTPLPFPTFKNQTSFRRDSKKALSKVKHRAGQLFQRSRKKPKESKPAFRSNTPSIVWRIFRGC